MAISKLDALKEAQVLDESQVPEEALATLADEPIEVLPGLGDDFSQVSDEELVSAVRGVIGSHALRVLDQAALVDARGMLERELSMGANSDDDVRLGAAGAALSELERRHLQPQQVSGIDALPPEAVEDAPASDPLKAPPAHAGLRQQEGTLQPKNPTPDELINQLPGQAAGAGASLVGGIVNGATEAVKGVANLAAKGALASVRGLGSVAKAPVKLSENIIERHQDKKIDAVRSRIESMFNLQHQMKLVPSWAKVMDDVEKLARDSNITKAEAMRKYEADVVGKANVAKAMNDEAFKSLRARFDDHADMLEKDVAAAADAAVKSGRSPDEVAQFVEEQMEKLGGALPEEMQKRLMEMAQRIKEMIQRLLEMLHITKPNGPSKGPALRPN